MSTDVIMPSLGSASEESRLLRWLVEEGDTVEKGQPIFEAESDKATVEVGAVASGTVGQLLASPGDVILAGEVVAILLAPDEEPMAEPLAPQPPVALRLPDSAIAKAFALQWRATCHRARTPRLR